MSDDEFSDAVSLVAAPATSAAMLRILANTYPALRAQIALHANADAALLDQLADDPDPSVKASVSVARQRVVQTPPEKPAAVAKASGTVSPALPSWQTPFVVAVDRGMRCGKCGALLYRAPAEMSKTCPACGVLNMVTAVNRVQYREQVVRPMPKMRSTDGNILGGLSMACVAVAMVSFCVAMGLHVPVASLILLLTSIAAIVLGALGVRSVARGEADNQGAAVAGLVIGIIGCLCFFFV